MSLAALFPPRPAAPLPAAAPGLSGFVWRGDQVWTDVAALAGWRAQRHALTGAHRLVAPSGAVQLRGSRAECLAAFPRSLRAPEHVTLLLHGLSCRPGCMAVMADRLAAAGEASVDLGYASTLRDLPHHLDAVEGALAFLADRGAREVSFVGYSLGGILARLATARRQRAWAGRIAVRGTVMVGTPNRGAKLAELLAPTRLLALMGPCGAALRPSAVAHMPAPAGPFATIAAGRGHPRRGWNPLLPGDNDFVVRTSEAMLDRAADHLDVRGHHIGILRDRQVADAAARFVSTGRLAA